MADEQPAMRSRVAVATTTRVTMRFITATDVGYSFGREVTNTDRRNYRHKAGSSRGGGDPQSHRFVFHVGVVLWFFGSGFGY